MKPFLGTDITQDKDNDSINGDCFIIKSASELQSEALDATTSDAAEAIEKMVNPLPLPLRIIEWVTFIAGCMIAGGIFKSLSGEGAVSLSKAYQNAPALFWIDGFCILTCLVLFLYQRSKIKKFEASGRPDEVTAKLDSVSEAIYFELGVPEDAAKVDILNLTYKIKNGEPVHKATIAGIPLFLNFEMRVFVEGDKLCLADTESKYAIPLASLTCIRTVNKKITLPMWNKDIAPDEGIYKQYKLKADNEENVMLEPYHILEFTHEGEVWGIYFPCYELPVMEALTGLSAGESAADPSAID